MLFLLVARGISARDLLCFPLPVAFEPVLLLFLVAVSADFLVSFRVVCVDLVRNLVVCCSIVRASGKAKVVLLVVAEEREGETASQIRFNS